MDGTEDVNDPSDRRLRSNTRGRLRASEEAHQSTRSWVRVVREGSGGRVVILQGVVPLYRRAFFENVSEEAGGRVTVFASEGGLDADGIQAWNGAAPWLRYCRAFRLVGGRLLLQPGAIYSLLSADVAVVPFSPRDLTSWIALILRRLVHRPTIVWGHFHPRGGAGKRFGRSALSLRLNQARLARRLLLYTETEAALARQRLGRGYSVEAAGNGLYFREELVSQPLKCGGPRNSVVYVGRLIGEKKVDLLIAAWCKIQDSLPSNSCLRIVGAGPELSSLRRLAEECEYARIRFEGPIWDVQRLAELYSSAVAAVQPGYVGLSAIQALGFGVPVITAEGERHSPEIEALLGTPYVAWYSSGSSDGLARRIGQAFAEWTDWDESLRRKISEATVDRYSIENMTEALKALIAECDTSGQTPLRGGRMAVRGEVE